MAELAALRAFTLRATVLTIELEVSDGALLGQLVPAQPGRIEVRARGSSTVVVADEIGCFAIDPIPAGPFRLHCRLPAGEVRTGWLTA